MVIRAYYGITLKFVNVLLKSYIRNRAMLWVLCFLFALVANDVLGFFCGSFLLFKFHVCRAYLSVHCSFVFTCWERANLLALLCVMFNCVFVTFPCGVLGQVSYLVVCIPDLCLLTYISCFVLVFWCRAICQFRYHIFLFACNMRLVSFATVVYDCGVTWCYSVGVILYMYVQLTVF